MNPLDRARKWFRLNRRISTKREPILWMEAECEETNCWAHGIFATPCSGRIDPHHLIKQQDLKRERVPREEWDDPRIVRAVCRGHHGVIHSHSFHLFKQQLPSSVLAYAKEQEIEHLLDRADQRRRETERPR
jgi:hypothetical protein